MYSMKNGYSFCDFAKFNIIKLLLFVKNNFKRVLDDSKGNRNVKIEGMNMHN